MSLDTLEKIINQSALIENDKKYLINLFSKAESDQLSELVSLIEENPSSLNDLLEIYKLKEESIKKKDKILWEKAVGKEIELIRKADSE
jgi:hypothetical protein